MNCKPGDLAVITAAYRDTAAVGHFVRVIEQSNGGGFIDGVLYGDFMGAWLCEGRVPDSYEKRVLNRVVIGDDYLRPIRDPGEDVQDETLQWLPVPIQHKEVA